MSYYSPSYHSPSYHPSYSPQHPAYDTHHHYHYEYHQPYSYASPYQHYGSSYGHQSYPSYHQSYPQHHDHHSYGYGHQPSYGHHGHSDHSMISAASLLIPLLGLIGLSLLVPNVLSGAAPLVTRIPAKRDVNGQVDKHAQALAHIYSAVLNSDSCIRKLYCEMGHLAKNTKDKQALFKLMDQMVPTQYKTELSILKASSESAEYMCKKFECKLGSPSKMLKNTPTFQNTSNTAKKSVKTNTVVYKHNSRVK